MFNLLRGWFDDAKVLDLFAGVGTIGLEAVSRGAREVVMVEMDRRIATILQRNINSIGCGEHATVVRADALGPAALAQAPRDCDVVFIDPPYELWKNPETQPRIIDLLVRVRACMRDKSFLVLRTSLPWDKEISIPGLEGPETHVYSLDMYVHLFVPALPEEYPAE